MSRPKRELPIPGDTAPSSRRPLPGTPANDSSHPPPPIPSRGGGGPSAPSRKIPPTPSVPEKGPGGGHRLPPRPIPRPSQAGRPQPTPPSRSRGQIIPQSVAPDDGEIYNEADVGEVYQECDVAPEPEPEFEQDEYDEFDCQEEDADEQLEYEDFHGVGDKVEDEPQTYDEFEMPQDTYEISESVPIQEEIYDGVDEDIAPPPPPSRAIPQPPTPSPSIRPPPPPPQTKRPPPNEKKPALPKQPMKQGIGGGFDLNEVLNRRKNLRRVESTEERPISTPDVKEYSTSQDVQARVQLFKQKEEAEPSSSTQDDAVISDNIQDRINMFGLHPPRPVPPSHTNRDPPSQPIRLPPSLPSKPVAHPDHSTSPVPLGRLAMPPRPGHSVTPPRPGHSETPPTPDHSTSPTPLRHSAMPPRPGHAAMPSRPGRSATPEHRMRNNATARFEKSSSTEKSPALLNPVSKVKDTPPRSPVTCGALPPTPVDRPSLPLPSRPELPPPPGERKFTVECPDSPELPTPPPMEDLPPPRPKDSYTQVDPTTKTSNQALVPNGNQNDWPDEYSDDDDQEIYDDVAATLKDPLCAFIWYHDEIERDEGNKKLKQISRDGAFLMRKSKQGGTYQPYTLMVYYSNYIYNLKVRLRSDKKYALGEEKSDEVTFKSVEELVKHHQGDDVILVHKSGKQYSTLLTVSPS